MKILSKSEFLKNEGFFINEIIEGKIFIYPTDTIYGIGCDAANGRAINKIREIKMRDSKPFSVIAPGKEWIKDNCIIDKKAEKWIGRLPGRYTLILTLKKFDKIARDEIVNGGDTIGVRIPDNWFSKVVKKFGRPFVTTSVNVTGQSFIRSLDDIEDNIKKKVDYAIDSGLLDNPPSQIVNLINGEKIIDRV